MRITRVRLATPTNNAVVYSAQPFIVEMDFRLSERASNFFVAFGPHSSDGIRLFECRSSDCYGPIPEMLPGEYSIRAVLNSNPLNPGLYTLAVGARCETKSLDYLPYVMTFRVELGKPLNSIWLEAPGGLVRQESEWTRPTATQTCALEVKEGRTHGR